MIGGMPSLPIEDDPGWLDMGAEVIAITEAADYRAARETSGELYRVIAAGTTLEKLSEALESEYAADLERATADVDAFLATLRARGVHGE